MPLSFLKLVGEPVDQDFIEVIAAQMRIAVRRLDLEGSFIVHGQNRNVERTAAQIEDGNGLILLLVESIGQRSRGRFIDDTHPLLGRFLGDRVFDLPFGIEAGDDAASIVACRCASLK